MNKQTTIAFKTLKDIYGKPSWADSNQRKSIEEEWDKALEHYSVEQVRTACLRYSKYKNTNKFPALACIEAELVDVEVNQDTSEDRKAQANRTYIYLLEHASECNPIPTKLACQRAIWNIYNVAVDGYKPEDRNGN